MKCFFVLVSALLFVSCASNKDSEASLTFHTQTPPGEMKNMVFTYTYKGQAMNIRKMPSFSLMDVETYQPFVAKKGGFGAIFKMDRTAVNRLFHHTAECQGSYMISVLNGTVGKPLRIDQPIKDGKLVIWDGLTQRDVHSLDVKVRREGDTDEQMKARAKVAKKALKNYKPF